MSPVESCRREVHDRSDVNKLCSIAPIGSWQSCYVPADQVETRKSNWYQIRSSSDIYIFRKSSIGELYEVAVNGSCITWLQDNNFELCLESKVDFVKPSPAAEHVYGILRARQRIRDAFFNEAIRAVQRCNPGLDSWLRRATLEENGPSLELELAILDRDILVNRSSVQLK